MVTAAGDEKKYGDWLKVLKYAAIGLAIIGLSWMIVSVIFWFVGTLSWKNQTQWTGVGQVDKNAQWTSLFDKDSSDDDVTDYNQGNVNPDQQPTE
jgi:hypothetical protein